MMRRAKYLKNGGSDGARTRDLRRDRPCDLAGKSTVGPTFRGAKRDESSFIVGTITGTKAWQWAARPDFEERKPSQARCHHAPSDRGSYRARDRRWIHGGRS